MTFRNGAALARHGFTITRHANNTACLPCIRFGERYGDIVLRDLGKFTLQVQLNVLAPNYSTSVLKKVRVYLNSILDEAVELEFLLRIRRESSLSLDLVRRAPSWR